MAATHLQVVVWSWGRDYKGGHGYDYGCGYGHGHGRGYRHGHN